MQTSLISARNRFASHHPETRRDVNGRQWGELRVGKTGPALLLLPGTLGRADIFWQQIEALQDRVRILALSYPDTGSIQDWCLDIDSILLSHGIETVTVLGSSLGGYLAQYFTATRPHLVRGLVAANTFPDLDIVSQSPPYNTDIDALPDPALMAGFAGKLRDLARNEPEREGLADLLLAEVEGRIPVSELRTRLKVLQNGPPLPPQTLDRSRIFTVESDDDQLIPAPVRDAVRDLLQPDQAFVYHKGTHFPYVTQPQKYTAMLAQILEL